MQSIPDQIEQIQYKAASHFGLTVADLLGPCKRRGHVLARKAATLSARRLQFAPSLTDLGVFFYRDHTTISHAVRTAKALESKHGWFAELVAELDQIGDW